jgi:hypothetical protein
VLDRAELLKRPVLATGFTSLTQSRNDKDLFDARAREVSLLEDLDIAVERRKHDDPRIWKLSAAFSSSFGNTEPRTAA